MKWLKSLSRKECRGASFLFLFMILMFITACGNASSNPTASSSGSNNEAPIKIGALLTSSGPFTSAGQGIKQGLELYLEQNNYKIGNRKVEVVYEDDQNDPQVSLRKLRKLVESDKIDILLGGVTSTVVYAIVDQVEKYKLPTIIVNGAADEVSWSKKSDYIYRASFSNWQLGSAPAAYIAKNIGKKVFLVSQDYPAGTEQASAFEAAFKAAGGTEVQTVFPKVGTADFATYIAQIAAAKPDAVYNIAGSAEGVNFALQYNSFGLKGKIPLVSQVADEIITTPEIVKALDGEYYYTMYTPQAENEANKKFVEAYRKKYNTDPTNFMNLGYDSGQMAVKTIEKAGGTKAEDLIKVLKDISIESPRGYHVMDPNTHNPNVDFYMEKYVAKNGKMTYQMLETIKNIKMPEKNPKR